MEIEKLHNRKYNYVIFGYGGLYLYSYSDVIGVEGVKFIKYLPTHNYIEKVIRKIHFSPKINKYLDLPFKKVWNYSFFQANFANNKPICFIFFNNWVILNEEINYTDYLRKKYTNCKLVWFLQDVLAKQYRLYNHKRLNIDTIKKKFDLILSFDKTDCEKYNLIYHPLVFSSYHGSIKELPHSDVYFLALAKDRLKVILQTYEVLRDAGLVLDFYLVGVKEEDQKYKDEIHYIQSMSYEENLQHIIHTNCLLEIMQKGSTGYTQRGAEAVCFGKKLLTNNTRINEEPFFISDYISMFSTPEDIDKDFLKRIPDVPNVDYRYKHNMSPWELLDFIDKKL